ncbi:MAG TPA: hypothetical protein DIW81_01425, partial [Planctomycetaceae bacterium]|nr:hypothetical protein [Planctomycetaceae bacterium]
MPQEIKSLMTNITRILDRNGSLPQKSQGRPHMRGFRRFCVGIAAMALAWSSTTVQAQPEPRYYEKSATPEGGWSPNSFQPQGPYGAGGPQTAGHWTPEMMAGGVQQAQFQQGPPPP